MSDATTSADATADDTADDAPAALPGDGLREGIVDALRAEIGEHLIDTHLLPQTDLWIRVAPEAWRQTGAALREQGFDYFCFLSAIDWMPSPYGDGEDDPSDDDDDGEPAEMAQGYTGGDTRFQLLARVTDLRRHVGVTIKVDVPDSMTLDSWVSNYAGANWHERETHEMFGILFDGHPDLRNLYLPGEFEGFPLRKDFPLLARMIKPWPGIVDVEPMPADEPASDATAAGDAVEAATDPTNDDETAPGSDDETAAVEDAVATADATAPSNPPTEATDADADTASAPDAGDIEVAEPAPADTSETARAERAEAAADAGVGADGTDPVHSSDGTVPADLGPGTTSESTDADPEAPTPGPPTEAHPDGLTPGDTDEGDRS